MQYKLTSCLGAWLRDGEMAHEVVATSLAIVQDAQKDEKGGDFMGKLLERYLTTTDRLVSIDWSGRGKLNLRRSRWGGYLASWKTRKPMGNIYHIPKSTSIEAIETALRAVLSPSDRAVLIYPYGKTRDGSSAMRVKAFGIQKP